MLKIVTPLLQLCRSEICLHFKCSNEAQLAWSALMMTRQFLIAIAMLTFSTATINSAPVPPPPKAASWEQILDWLPEDTETLIVSPHTFVFPKMEPDKENAKWLSISEALPTLAAGPLLAVDVLVEKELAGVKCLCMVEGSRCFTRPKDIGLMPYQGAHIMQFDPDSSDTVRKVFEACRKKADKEIQVQSHPVAVYYKDQESDKWSYYVAQPLPGVLICATHQGYLEETLKRIANKSRKRAFPTDLPEWKHVDVKARVWAIRHYREEYTDEDPTSPLNSKDGKKQGSDNAAMGFVFWYNPDISKVVQIRYLSDAKAADKIATEAWAQGGVEPKIKKVDAGIVEITVELSKENEGMFLLVLLLQLGHAILF